MKYEEFDTVLLKAYASFLYSNLNEVINNFHLKNLQELSAYSQLNESNISSLIDSEIRNYLKSIQEGTIIKDLSLWISKTKANQISWISTEHFDSTFIRQILFNRKLCLIELLSKYTNDVNLSILIIKDIEYLSLFQESLVLEFSKLQSVRVESESEHIKPKEQICQLEQFLEYTFCYINIYDLDIDRLTYNNFNDKTIFGYTPEEVMESNFSSFINTITHLLDKEKIKDKIRSLSYLKDKEIIELKYRIIDKVGSTRWIFLKATVFKRIEERVIQVLLFELDITELEKVKEEKEYIKEQLKEAQEISHIGNYDWDIINDIITYTDEAYNIYDLPRQQKSFKVADFTARLKPEDAKKFEENLNTAFKNKSSFQSESQYRIILPDKTEKIILSSSRIIRDEIGHPVRMLGTVMDITILKELRIKNMQIKESEERYRFLAENVPQLFWTARPDGGLDFLNHNAYTYTGSSFELIGDWNWQNFIHPDDLSDMFELWVRSLRTGVPFETEFRIRRFDGIYRWHLVKTVALKNEEGKVIKWMGTATDIDEQKKYAEELKSKNTLLIKVNNDLDNFIYTASHDLKTPISNIEGLLNALNDEINEDGNVSVFLSMMKTSVEKFKKTLLDLTEISKAQKSGEEPFEEIDIKELLEDIKSSLEIQINTTQAEIKTEFDCCSTIRFSRKNLKSIIYNLLSNALKFKAPQRRPEIFVKTRIEDGCIELSVKDNGQGFDIKQKAKIFDMFKRLQSEAEGTGVGLYLVKRIITNSGGKIEVESEIGKGSVFKVYIPMER
ncbi:sensor histidine kinase [Sporocytophaga myxococcoides]|uniref:sensor histidine kinase n=1 Tax=Sporocytophaga myxococcoides TaxID=153721 RepID=UPI00040E817C|nr:PAS domain-containing protein [Sporocytophaga myxococcoides]